jgi:hypothetical protein
LKRELKVLEIVKKETIEPSERVNHVI